MPTIRSQSWSTSTTSSVIAQIFVYWSGLRLRTVMQNRHVWLLIFQSQLGFIPQLLDVVWLAVVILLGGHIFILFLTANEIWMAMFHCIHLSVVLFLLFLACLSMMLLLRDHILLRIVNSLWAEAVEPSARWFSWRSIMWLCILVVITPFSLHL